MNGLEWLAENEDLVRGLTRNSCRGRADLMPMLWDEAVDRIGRLVEVTYEPEKGDLQAYVMVSLRWYFFKRMSKAYNESLVPLEDEFELVDPRDDESTHDSQERVEYILSHVDEDDQALLRMHLVEGLSFEAISRRTGFLRPTIYKRYRAALARLKEALYV